MGESAEEKDSGTLLYVKPDVHLTTAPNDEAEIMLFWSNNGTINNNNDNDNMDTDNSSHPS